VKPSDVDPLKQLNAHQDFTSDDVQRPDPFIYNDKIVFGEGDKDHPVSSITLVEFKKPQRNDYSPADNPIMQCFDLVMPGKEIGCFSTSLVSLRSSAVSTDA
jgi:hypothetical protein